MEDDPAVRKQRQRLERLHEQVASMLGRAQEALDAAASQAPAAGAGRWDKLQTELQQMVQDYLAEGTTFIESARDRAREIEEAKRRAAMSEKRSTQPRDDARIKELSDELSTKLRLDRIDAAIKELLDFLGDAEFFEANASTGRRRRLRSLGNAIEKGLGK